VFAAWADADGRAGLLRTLDDRDARVRAAAVLALADDPDDAVGPRLLLAAADADPLVRATALDGLAARVAWGRDAGHRGVGDRAPRSPVPGNPAAREVADAAARLFVAGSGDPDARVRLSALEGSVAMAGETAVFAVGKGLADPVWSVRLVAAELAGTVRDRGVLAPLVAALRDARERVARAASVALVRLTGIPFDDDVARWTAWLEGDGARFDPAEAPPPSSRAEGHARTAATARFLDLDLISSRVTFVLDASGSMSAREPDGRTRWELVVAELDRALERLGREAEGNVILFSNDAMALFPQAVRFTPAVRTKVRETLHARRPAGRTALYDGIALALDDAAVDSLVVLSDGVPSTGACLTRTDIRAELRRANRWRRARIDVISIGAGEVSERWKPLLEEIATDHGGRLLAK
jgi:hypothetical protein